MLACWQSAFKKIGLPPAMLCVCARFIAPERPYVSSVPYVYRRPFDNAWTYGSHDDEVSTLQCVELRVSDTEEEGAGMPQRIVTVICDVRLCFRWWPSLARVQRLCALPNTARCRQRLRRHVLALAHELSSDLWYVERVGPAIVRRCAKMTAAGLSRASISSLRGNVIELTNAKNAALRDARLDAHIEYAKATVVVENERAVIIPVPIAVDALPQCGARGVFVPDAEGSVWGRFVSRDRSSARIPRAVLDISDDSCEFRDNNLQQRWMTHVWADATKRIQQLTNSSVTIDFENSQHGILPFRGDRPHRSIRAPRA